ncbi:hypothetical protein [Candidatus Nitrosocosmicus arcticus]|uniref:Uncharacterized protein n=1 Tax=Candidatus Nitrosocosmicus arcticus TaxID=2035267 RepID=A0A557SWG7_9ARCH|nr:hypothetical protein [Candidatus Nitrosocosmicus arcticus]TVP40946.1 hypothetical protein NARC_50127 [Candidatus Nitrosocosmicus arcticus]
MLRSKKTTSLFLPTTLIALLCYIFTFAGSDPSLAVNFGFAQNLDSSTIQILSTSTFIDDLGNFHIIGEVNNTSLDPQTNIVITTLLSNTTNNIIVGNYSAFSSIGTLRHGESSPFDILIQDPQIVGKFNFIEFFSSSQPGIEKPANLIINGSSTFLDNTGNPHITGNMINQGQFPEQFLNLVATFYDNSSQGVVGTQSFGLNVGNLSQSQMAPFDITILDNKTKSQGGFYSLNVESDQSSMSLPFNSKSSFVSAGGFSSGVDISSTNPPLNSGVGFSNNDINNNDSSNPGNDSDNDNQNNDDNQRGEKKTDDNGNPYYNDENCSEESGSSGGNSSECQDAENEEQSEQEDEDSSEQDQGPPSSSDSTGGNNGEGEGTGNESDSGENTDSNEGNDNGDDSDNN